MIRLDNALHAWGTPDFTDVLKQELAGKAEHLPLQQGLTVGNYVTDQPVSVSIISMDEAERSLRVHVGIIYSSVIAGCSCADDPTPVNENTEYCELLLEIDRANAASVVTLVSG